MTNNIWFQETFLTSIFNKFGINNGTWLTQKQTEICLKGNNMEEKIIKRNSFENHSNFVTVWNDRKVVLFYSKVSKTGKITFYNTDAELNILKEVNESIEKTQEIERFLKHPKALDEAIELEQRRIEMYLEEITDNFDAEQNTRLLNNSNRELQRLLKIKESINR